MTRKKVIAYGMHEQELEDIRTVIKNPQYTDSFIVGELEDREIDGLRAKGIIVEVKPEQEAIHTPGTLSNKPLSHTFDPKPGLWERFKDAAFGTTPTATTSAQRKSGRPKSLGAAPENIPPYDPSRAYPYLIRLKGPLIEEWRAHLNNIDIKLIEFIPENSYTALINQDQLIEARKLSFVIDVKSYRPEDTPVLDYMKPKSRPKSMSFPPGGVDAMDGPSPAAPMPSGAAPIIPDELDEQNIYDVRMHAPDFVPIVFDWLNEQNVEIVGTSERKIRIKIPAGSSASRDVAFLPEVAEVQPYKEPKLFNDRARQIIELDTEGTPPATLLPQTGDGEIIAVADTGIDDTHPDFPTDRVVQIIARGRAATNDASDPNGHGTHVAGSVLGDGTASNGAIRGTAPNAKLVFQSLMDSEGGLSGLPVDLGDLFEEAYQLGARIHNNSWGADTESLYTFNSIEVDEFVTKRRDMLLVIAGGNEGIATENMTNPAGVVDWLSMGSPATAKNALTIGASRSDRTEGGWSTNTYGSIWPGDFPDPPIGLDKISGNPQAIAGFSSRGPCDDRRIKPELVAPGTDVLSARSSTAPDNHYWGLSNNPKYAYMGGTSMATPIVSGCAALVREYFVKERNADPSAALLKATLINSSISLGAPDAMADHDKLPNYHQGFGRICMTNAIPNDQRPGMQLNFVDSWQDPQQQLTGTGDRLRYFFRISGGDELRICLAWTDIPGRGVQNSLGILLEHQGTVKKWLGNADRLDAITPIDRDNNVHVIHIENPPVGDYVIQIFARNLLRPPQDFALVVFGQTGSDQLTRI